MSEAVQSEEAVDWGELFSVHDYVYNLTEPGDGVDQDLGVTRIEEALDHHPDGDQSVGIDSTGRRLYRRDLLCAAAFVAALHLGLGGVA